MYPNPNETLRQIRETLTAGEWSLSALQDLSTKFRALDDWLTNGGFLPTDWIPKH